jgi:hypothetical protein
LWSLKQGSEQLGELVMVCGRVAGRETDYGSAQVGHLYFFGSAAQTPQREEDMVVASMRYVV